MPYNRSTVHLECKNKSDTRNNGGKWNRFRTIQRIPERRRGKARNQGAKKTAILGIARTLESTSVKVQEI
jgi:hypothetical protein